MNDNQNQETRMARKLPQGRTEIPLDGGKYLAIVDYREKVEGFAILRHGKPWATGMDIRPPSAFIAAIMELEKCRDLLHEILIQTKDASPNLAARIEDVLPMGYEPAEYVR